MLKIVLFAFLICLTQALNTLGIKKLSNCKVQLNDKSIIDLTSKDNAGNPRSVKDPPYYTYTYNPCTAISCASNEDSAFCQSDGGRNTYSLGKQTTVDFNLNNGVLEMHYTDGSGDPSTGNQRQSIVKCVCSDSEGLTYDGEDQSQLLYMASFQSICCCPNKCGGGGGGGGSDGSKGLSGGSIFLIILLSFSFTYIIVGIVIMKFKKQASGLDMLPNRQIWSSLLDHTKVGFKFTLGKLRGSQSGYENL